MERIKDTLQVVFSDLVAKKIGTNGDGPQEWLKKTLTKNEFGHIKFQYFRKGILGVLVDSSAQLYSLNLKKERVLRGLKKYCAEIKELRLSIGDING